MISVGIRGGRGSSGMKISTHCVAIGMGSKFNFMSPVWFYRSKYERWAILRVCGIYFWFVVKEFKIF